MADAKRLVCSQWSYLQSYKHFLSFFSKPESQLIFRCTQWQCNVARMQICQFYLLYKWWVGNNWRYASNMIYGFRFFSGLDFRLQINAQFYDHFKRNGWDNIGHRYFHILVLFLHKDDWQTWNFRLRIKRSNLTLPWLMVGCRWVLNKRNISGWQLWPGSVFSTCYSWPRVRRGAPTNGYHSYARWARPNGQLGFDKCEIHSPRSSR